MQLKMFFKFFNFFKMRLCRVLLNAACNYTCIYMYVSSNFAKLYSCKIITVKIPSYIVHVHCAWTYCICTCTHVHVFCILLGRDC